MSLLTKVFKFIKPELTDPANITAFNENWDTIDTQLNILRNPVPAISTDGINYTATIEGVTSLSNGLTITVIPTMNSVQPNINLNLNGLGAKNVRMTLPFSSGNSGALATVNSWFSADAPMTLRYHAKMNIWKSDLQRQSAQNLYGSVPVQNGGWYIDNSTTDENITDALNAYKQIGLAQAWTVNTSTNNTVDVTLADKTEYKFPYATTVNINAPSTSGDYESYITIGGKNPTITFSSGLERVGLDLSEIYAEITNTEISIKNGKYVVGITGVRRN